MARGFFKNYRAYFLATVTYMGSLLFGKAPHVQPHGIRY
jgi:hypothetical protein